MRIIVFKIPSLDALDVGSYFLLNEAYAKLQRARFLGSTHALEKAGVRLTGLRNDTLEILFERRDSSSPVLLGMTKGGVVDQEA